MNTKPSFPGAGASRYVVVTGAGSGIGKATTAHLLGAGYRVLGGAISADEAQRLQAEFGPGFTPLRMDVRNESSVEAAAAQVAALLGPQRLAALLNIAGVISNGPLVDLSADAFSNLLAVNLVGMHAVTRAFLPLLGSDPRRCGAPGRIINMGSASGTRTMPFAGAYSASKFGVEALSTAMRLEFRPFGIAVVVIAPGLIHTPMAAHIQSELQKPPSLAVYQQPLQRFLEQTRQATRQGIPLERVVRTIADAVDRPHPPARYAIHHHFFRDAVLMRALPVRYRDALVGRWLGLHKSAP